MRVAWIEFEWMKENNPDNTNNPDNPINPNNPDKSTESNTFEKFYRIVSNLFPKTEIDPDKDINEAYKKRVESYKLQREIRNIKRKMHIMHVQKNNRKHITNKPYYQ